MDGMMMRSQASEWIQVIIQILIHFITLPPRDLRQQLIMPQVLENVVSDLAILTCGRLSVSANHRMSLKDSELNKLIFQSVQENGRWQFSVSMLKEPLPSNTKTMKYLTYLRLTLKKKDIQQSNILFALTALAASTRDE